MIRPLHWPRRIRRILQWLPLLWHDEDWDCDDHLVRIVQFKLRRIADHIEAGKHHLEWKRQVRDIRITVARFDRHLNSLEYGPPLPDPDRECWVKNERGLTAFTSTPAQNLWAKRHGYIENENWHAAWEMIRKRGRGWWD